MEIPHEQGLCMSGDHLSLCRFSKDDGRFETVVRRIRRLVNESPKGISTNVSLSEALALSCLLTATNTRSRA